MFVSQRLIFAAFFLLFLGGAFRGITSAQNPGVSPHPVDKFALADDEVKQLLLLMDTNKNGKVSKQEYMNFMEIEFDRLDVNKNGELDPKELANSRFRVSRFAAVGK